MPSVNILHKIKESVKEEMVIPAVTITVPTTSTLPKQLQGVI